MIRNDDDMMAVPPLRFRVTRNGRPTTTDAIVTRAGNTAVTVAFVPPPEPGIITVEDPTTGATGEFAVTVTEENDRCPETAQPRKAIRRPRRHPRRQ